MRYEQGRESSPPYPTINRKRTSPSSGRVALIRCLCVAPPNLAGIRLRRTTSGHSQAVGVPQTGGAQLTVLLMPNAASSAQHGTINDYSSPASGPMLDQVDQMAT